jgi:hypothetical protein
MGFPRSHLLSKRRVLENFVQNIHFFAPLIITVFFLCRLNSALLSDIIKGNRDSLNSKKIKLFKETPRLPTKGSFFIAFILSLIEFYFYEDLQNRTFFYVLTICRYFFCVPLSKRMVFMRVALYIRVSTQEQAEEGYSISSQKQRLLAYCKARGWIVVSIFADPGESGSNLERPGIQRLISFVEEKKCDTVLVLKLDRISRSQKDTLFLLEDVFLKNDINFLAVEESFDTSTPYGIAMVGILSSFAQLERENIKSRTMSGRTGRAQDGLWHGGGTHPIGYDYINGRLVVNKSEARQVQAVYRLYASGSSIADIQEKMKPFRTKHGDWSLPATIINVLENELYAGVVHFNGVRTPDSHEAIVSPELYAKVQALRERYRVTRHKQRDSRYLLSGFVVCGRCGAGYGVKWSRSGNHSYVCYSRSKTKKSLVKDPSCKNKRWPVMELDRIVQEELFRLAADPMLVDRIIEERANTEMELNQMKDREEIASIDRQISRLMDLYQDDRLSVDEIASRIDALYQKRMQLAPDDGVGIGEKPNKIYQVERVKLLLRNLPEVWNSGDNKVRRRLLVQILDKIEIDGDKVSFDWSFA